MRYSVRLWLDGTSKYVLLTDKLQDARDLAWRCSFLPRVFAEVLDNLKVICAFRNQKEI